MEIVEFHPAYDLPACEDQERSNKRPKLADEASTDQMHDVPMYEDREGSMKLADDAASADQMTVSLDDLSPEESLAYGIGVLIDFQFDELSSIFDKIASTHPQCRELSSSLMEEMAKLAWLLCDQDEALRSYHFCEINSLENKLWNQMIKMGEQEVSVQNLCQVIFRMNQLTASKYDLIGEEEIGSLIWRYAEALNTSIFVEQDLEDPLVEVDKTDKFFVHACNTRKQLRHMTDAERIHLKKELLFSTCWNVVQTLRAEAKNKIRIDSLFSLDNGELWNILPTGLRKNEIYGTSAAETLDNLLNVKIDRFIGSRQRKVERQARFALGGLLILADSESLIVPDDVRDVARVANVIRRLEDHRFISQHHFVQAFKEMGFDHCFSKLTVKIPETSTADRPPFHVYATSIALVKHLGVDTINLEHLAFAVIHAKSMSPSDNEVAKMGESFKRLFHSTSDTTVHPMEQLRKCIWVPVKVFDSDEMEQDKERRASE